jgi:aspartate/methionine/tyrosine aminotransferase
MIANKYLIKQVLKIHDSIVTCAPSHSQYAVMQNLDSLFKFAAKINKSLEKRRDFVVEELEKMSKYITFEVPNGSYYIFPKFKYTK